MNNDFSGFQSEINYYCGTMIEAGETEEALNPYNPVPAKFSVLEGRMLAMPVAHSRPVIQTPQAMQKKTKEFQAQIRASVEAAFVAAKRELELENQGYKPEEIAKILEAEKTEALPVDLSRKNYRAQGEIIFAKLMQWQLNEQNIKTKKVNTLKDLLVGSRVASYCGWRYGRPVVEELNILNLEYFKNENESRLEKSDYVYYQDTLTAGEAIQEYGNELDDKTLQELLGGQFMGHVPKDALYQPTKDMAQYYSTRVAMGESYNDWRGGLAQSTNYNNGEMDRIVTRIHCEFKAFSPVIFLSFKDEYGQRITEKLSGDANVIPSSASEVEFTNRFFERAKKWVWVDEISGIEYEAEILWIPRRHEFTLLDDDHMVRYREVPNQPEYHDNPFADFELSYKGRLLYSRNADWISPLKRALPYAFQIMAAKRLIDREMAKYEGKSTTVDVDQIPTNLALETMNGMQSIDDAVLRNKIIARKTSTWYYSGGNSRNGALPSSTRSVGVQHTVTDTASQMIALQNLVNLIDVELGMALGIPPQSQGIVTPGTNARDNQQTMVQHTLSAQIIYYYLEDFWNSTLNEHMKNVLHYIRLNLDDLGHTLEAVLPDNTTEFFKVMPEDIEFMKDLGLTLQSNGREQLYFDLMTNQVFSIAQNAGEGAVAISSLLKAITTSASPEEMHAQIEKSAAEQAKRIQAQQEREAELQKQNVEQQLELERAKAGIAQETQLTLIRQKGAENARAADIQASMMERQADINENEVSDKLEGEREQREFDREENEKDRILDLKIARLKGSKQS